MENHEKTAKSNALEEELNDVFERLDTKQFGWFPDMCGVREVYVEPDAEARELLARGAMIVELLELRQPLIGRRGQPTQTSAELGTEWCMLMHFGMCPCPGVPRERWEAK